MVGWHHQLNGHESEQTLGDTEGQGGLACCSPWGCKESRHDLATEQQREMVFKMIAFMKQKQDVIKRNTRDKNT